MTDPLRNYDNWQESVRNFQWLHESVSGAMDVDFMVERNGLFLVIEAKPWTNGVKVPWGQHKALYRLSQVPGFRVYLVGEGNGKVHVANVATSPKPKYLRTERMAFWPPDRFIPSTKEALADMVRAWWDDAALVAA